MALVRVKPTDADVAIADAIAGRTTRPIEHVAEALTWGADEHVLCALAFGWWLYARSGDAQIRRSSDHVLLTTLVASALPHALKRVFDQQRPDRLTALGHLHGIPFSGKRLDAFPSGPSDDPLALPRHPKSGANIKLSRVRNNSMHLRAGRKSLVEADLAPRISKRLGWF
jgi:hypothetical protein